MTDAGSVGRGVFHMLPWWGNWTLTVGSFSGLPCWCSFPCCQAMGKFVFCFLVYVSVFHCFTVMGREYFFDWEDLYQMTWITSGRFWREVSWPLISSRGLSPVPNHPSLLWCLLFSYMLVLNNPENCFIFSASPERMTQTLNWKKAVTFEVFVLRIGRASISRSCLLSHRSVSAFLWILFQNWQFLFLWVSPFL